MSILKIAEVANNVLDKFVQDKDLKEQLSHDLQKELISLDKAQISLNAEEAKNRNWFVSIMETIHWIYLRYCFVRTLHCTAYSNLDSSC